MEKQAVAQRAFEAPAGFLRNPTAGSVSYRHDDFDALQTEVREAKPRESDGGLGGYAAAGGIAAYPVTEIRAWMLVNRAQSDAPEESATCLFEDCQRQGANLPGRFYLC